MLNAASAGTLRVAGENAKSFASSARIGGVGVGVDPGVGRGVGSGMEVGLVDGAVVGDKATGSTLAGGSDWGTAEGIEVAGVSVGGGGDAIDDVGSEATAGVASVLELCVGAPHATTSRPMAMSRGSLTESIAAV